MCGTSIFQEPGYPAGPGGFVVNFSGERRPRHHHSELEFNLVISGTACFSVGPRTLQVRPGSLLWFLPCQDHLMHWASPDFQMWIVAVKLGLLETGLCTRALADLLLIRDQCQQLDTGERNLVRAARTAGFGSYPQFHRVIREQTGYCPSEYASESVGATAWRRKAPGSGA